MKKSRFSERQVIAILKQADGGTPVPELCREHGMSSALFYRWRSKFGGMDASMRARLKELEEENRRLKKMYAEERLKAEIVAEALKKSGIAISTTRNGAMGSARQGCQHSSRIPGVWHQPDLLSVSSKAVFREQRDCRLVIRLTANQRNWGFGLCFLYLRIKPKKRLVRENPEPLSEPTALNQVWSMDFMHDQLSDGRSIRLFNRSMTSTARAWTLKWVSPFRPSA